MELFHWSSEYSKKVNNTFFREKLPSNVARDLLLFGNKLTGKESKQLGIVDQCSKGEELLNKAIDFAKKISIKGKDRKTFKEMRERMFSSTIRIIQNRKSKL